MTQIAFLRGINVSGKNMISMDELKKALALLTFNNIRTYIQSGNILFETGETDAPSLEKKIHDRIAEQFGLEVPVVTRSRDELEKIHHDNPFINERTLPVEKLHVTLLKDPVDPDILEKIDTGKYLPDEFIPAGKEIYLYCPDGYGRTKLTNQFFENKVKSKATTRNWKTIETLLKM